MINVFSLIRALPHRTPGSVLVQWQAAVAGEAYVYRSTDGWHTATLLNEQPADHGEWLDADGLKDPDHLPCYRVTIEVGTQEYDSPAVGLFDALNQRELHGLQTLLAAERLHLIQGRNGIPLWLASPLERGTPCPSIAGSGQRTGGDCPDNPVACYGQKFVGGFQQPRPTYARLVTPAKRSRQPRDGLGEGAQRTSLWWFLAYPTPQRTDLVIDAATGRHFAILEVNPKLFAGVAPIAHEVALEQLPQTDPRCGFIPQQLFPHGTL